ncbi:hypothetical protein CspeluHIS016_0113630 [Cutaneotrichosporon spelunceum]|uniref:Protein kinase domain-containing protein n=1 Tax=Cutaneotrichosporon spelunceum TaxID=1672016 RepID=A0AAD3TQV1_9TREE|nr:hypothetical protein CspeluHIS016_0113630 [Cutaneotrichosporon spelunceum]
MSDYYMPRDGAQGIKRESTWRPKEQPSRPANAWADAPGPSGPTRKGEYYEPPRRDERDRERQGYRNREKGKEPEDRDDRGRSRSRSRSRSGERDRDGRDFRDRDRGGWRKEDNRTWEDYRRRRRSPERRWERDDNRNDRWRADSRRDRDRSRERERDEPPRRWGRSSPERDRRSPSPPPRKRGRSPVLRKPSGRASPDYGTLTLALSASPATISQSAVPFSFSWQEAYRVTIFARSQTCAWELSWPVTFPKVAEVARPVAVAQSQPAPKSGDALPYDVTPERDAPTDGGGAQAVRTATRDWKPAPKGPAAHRNGTKEETAKGAIQVDVPEIDIELDHEPPPTIPKRSDKWSPVARWSPVRPGPPLAPSTPTVSVSQPPAALPPQSVPSVAGPASVASRPAFVPRVPPPGPISITSAPSPGPSGPASGPGTPRAETFLNRLADKQQQFDRHLSTIAPYISTAFEQWYAKNATPPLHQFLIHHFGRQPSTLEMDQIHQLLRMRSQLSKDQQELTNLHAQAVRSERILPGPPPDAPVGPRATRDRDQVRGGGMIAGAAPSPPLGLPPFPVPGPPLRQATKPKPKPVVAPKAPRPRAVAGERYERLAQVGEGTYGKVYKARNTGSGTLVALKRIRMEQERDGFPVTSMREIKLLQALDHPNIVRLMEMMVSHNSVYMVLEYMNHDLTGILSHPEVKLTPANIKSLNYQMLSGLGYLHRRGILHRDMKGSNILLNGAGELKLADFGLARWYHKHKRDDYTNRVITLWYRSPELLMGETAYGPEVDTWSAGCIVLEIFMGKPTFQGQDEISQLDAIWAIMGTPCESDWPGVTELPWYELVRPREALPSRFAEKFSLSPGAMEVVRGLLELNPAKRLLADDALDAAYFTTEAPEMEQPTQLAACGEHHEMTVKMHRRREK